MPRPKRSCPSISGGITMPMPAQRLAATIPVPHGGRIGTNCLPSSEQTSVNASTPSPATLKTPAGRAAPACFNAFTTSSSCTNW
jgi:hypothetical protein